MCPLKQWEFSPESITDTHVATEQDGSQGHKRPNSHFKSRPASHLAYLTKCAEVRTLLLEAQICIFLILVFTHLRKIFHSGKKYFCNKTMSSFKIVSLLMAYLYTAPYKGLLHTYVISFVSSRELSPHFKVKQKFRVVFTHLKNIH